MTRKIDCVNRVSRWILLPILLVVVISAGSASAGPPPDFRLQDPDGNWVTLSEQLGGEVVYVTFWATWCVPCRREMPHLEKLQQELGDAGLTIIGVNTDPPGTTSKISYTTLLDPNNNVLDKYNPTRELPYAVLIDRDGNVSQVFPGYRTGDENVLKEKIVALLETDPRSTVETPTGEIE